MNTTDTSEGTDEAVAPVTGRLLGVVSNAHTLLGARPVREADLPGWMREVGMGNAEGGTGSRGDAEGAEGVGGGVKETFGN